MPANTGGRAASAASDQTRPGTVRCPRAEAGRDWLVSDGVPSGSVVASPVGTTTLVSLRAAATWMGDRGLDSAFLVSDPWHNLRMKRMASDLGIEAYASATWQSAARTEGTRFGGYVRETLAYLYARLPMFHRIGKAAYKADLSNTLALMEILGHPERVHVGVPG